MNCNLANDYMMIYFDRSINDIENAQLKAHLKTCSHCKEEFQELSSIFESLESGPVIEPPQDFEEKVMQKVAMVEHASRKSSERTVAVLYGISTMLLVALSVVLILGFNNPDISGIIQRVSEGFGESSGMAAAVYSLCETFLVLGKGVFLGLLQAAFVIAKTYYYVFIILAFIFVIIQKGLIELIRQNDGGIQ